MLKNIGTIFKDKKLRAELFGFWIFAGIAAFYILCFIYYYILTKEVTANPIEQIKYFSEAGNAPYKFLVIIIPLLMVFGLLSMCKKLGDLELDPRNFRYSKSGIYGTAHMMNEEEMKDVALVQKVEECNGTILGQLDRTGKKVINMRNDAPDLRINRHVLVFGASQSGKTFCYAKPFCYQAAKRGESLIVTDPKGELYEDMAEYFRNQGYVVKKFDIKTPLMSDGWDCLAEVRGDDFRASIFADVVIRNTHDGHGKGGDPVFEDGPKALLKAVLLYVAKSNNYGGPGQKPRSFASAFELVKEASKMGETGLDAIFYSPDACQEARDAYDLFKGASVNLRGNLIVGLGTRLQVLANKVVKEITGENDIDLTLPGKRPCAYFCIMSDQHRTFNFLSALFFSFLFIDLVEFADSQPNRACPVPVNFLLDEFANIGTIPDFDQKIATIRSRALYVSVICQDIGQLMNRYPDTYTSIMSNCATHLCIGFNDLDTQAYYEKRAGDTTVQVKTEQHAEKDPLFSVGLRHSTGDGRRSIMTSDELARLTPDECLIVFQGHNIIKAFKFGHTLHPESKKTRKIKSGNTPPITDKAARQRIRTLENERVRRFDEWKQNGCPEDQKPYVIPMEQLEDGSISVMEYCQTDNQDDALIIEDASWADFVPDNIEEMELTCEFEELPEDDGTQGMTATIERKPDPVTVINPPPSAEKPAYSLTKTTTPLYANPKNKAAAAKTPPKPSPSQTTQADKPQPQKTVPAQSTQVPKQEPAKQNPKKTVPTQTAQPQKPEPAKQEPEKTVPKQTVQAPKPEPPKAQQAPKPQPTAVVAPPPLPVVSTPTTQPEADAGNELIVKVASAIGANPHGSQAVKKELDTTKHRNKRVW